MIPSYSLFTEFTDTSISLNSQRVHIQEQKQVEH